MLYFPSVRCLVWECKYRYSSCGLHR